MNFCKKWRLKIWTARNRKLWKLNILISVNQIFCHLRCSTPKYPIPKYPSPKCPSPKCPSPKCPSPKCPSPKCPSPKCPSPEYPKSQNTQGQNTQGRNTQGQNTQDLNNGTNWFIKSILMLKVPTILQCLGILGLWVFWPWLFWAWVFWVWVFCPATHLKKCQWN